MNTVTDDLTAASLRSLRAAHVVEANWVHAEAEMATQLSAEQRDIVQQVIAGTDGVADARLDVIGAELARHFPGMAGGLLAVLTHIRDADDDQLGVCCKHA